MFYRDGALHVADAAFPLADGRVPLEALRESGVVGLAGKAVMLAVQVRWGAGGAELALPASRFVLHARRPRARRPAARGRTAPRACWGRWSACGFACSTA